MSSECVRFLLIFFRFISPRSGQAFDCLLVPVRIESIRECAIERASMPRENLCCDVICASKNVERSDLANVEDIVMRAFTLALFFDVRPSCCHT